MSSKKTKTPKRKPKRTANPTAAALEAMPEFNFERAKQFGRGPKAREAALKVARMHRRDADPGKDDTRVPSTRRSLRLPKETWEALERQAKKRGMTVHALLRAITIDWLQRS